MQRLIVMTVLLIGLIVLIATALRDDDSEPAAPLRTNQADAQEGAGELMGRADGQTDTEETASDPSGDASSIRRPRKFPPHESRIWAVMLAMARPTASKR